MRITRLGQGVDRDGMLSIEAIDRTLNVLAEFRSVLDDLDVDQVRMVATSAVRDAENGPVFVEAAGKIVGTDPETLSGQSEGQLAYRGAVDDLDTFSGDTVVVDIGGVKSPAALLNITN